MPGIEADDPLCRVETDLCLGWGLECSAGSSWHEPLRREPYHGEVRRGRLLLVFVAAVIGGALLPWWRPIPPRGAVTREAAAPVLAAPRAELHSASTPTGQARVEARGEEEASSGATFVSMPSKGSSDGRIVGRVVVPDGIRNLEAPWILVTWGPEGEPVLDPLQTPRERLTAPRANGDYALEGVPCDIDLVVRVTNPYGPVWSDRVRLEPRETRELWIHLESHPTISGRVIDEEGRPVEGLFVKVDGDSAADARGNPYARTDHSGRFVVRAPPQEVRLSVGGALARRAEVEVDLRNGSVEGVLLTVLRGTSIAGTVVWPDEAQAYAFQVWSRGPGGGKFTEGGSGRFELDGLAPGRHDLLFQARRETGPGMASVQAVETGTRDLRVVLDESPGFEVSGVVTDVRGAAVPRFRVFASVLAGDTELPSRFESVEGAGGRFVLAGLEPGEWVFNVSAEGFQEQRQTRTVDGPTELAFVLEAGGRIRGVVLDPAGRPAPGVWVGEEHAAFTTRSSGLGSQRTDEDGGFDVAISGSTQRLVAVALDHAPSEAVVVVSPPGANVEGVVLRLREACAIEGRVLDPRGDPVPLARVDVSAGPSGLLRERADVDGAFRVERIPAGPLRVWAAIPDGTGASPSLALTLRPGETRAVQLRCEPPDPVRVRARLTFAGAPVECDVHLHSESFATGARSDPDGCLELTLQRPGAWVGFAWVRVDAEHPHDLERNDVRRLEVTVPDDDEVSLPLELEGAPRVHSLEELWR